MFQILADYLTYGLFGMSQGKLADSVNFLIYDLAKIFSLIIIVLFVISFVQTFIPLDKLKTTLTKRNRFIGYPVSAFFGAVSPFCSCSSIPLFIGFIKARMPLGIAFAFLVTSPLVNEVVFVMMGGMFGWKIAISYALSGIMLGVVSGMVIDFLNLEGEIVLKDLSAAKDMDSKKFPTSLRGKIMFAKKETLSMLKKLWWIIVIGVSVGAVFYGYVPQEFFKEFVGEYSLFEVPMAVLLGIPIYAGCSMVVPVIFSVTQVGVPLGTSLAFLMSIAGLSLPEAIMLRRVISLKLLLIFFGLVTIGIIAIGYLFNAIM